VEFLFKYLLKNQNQNVNQNQNQKSNNGESPLFDF